MKRLAEAFEMFLQILRPAFPQRRTFEKARRLAYGLALAWGRRTVSRALCATHDQFHDWSAAYRLFSRSPWKPRDLFEPVLHTCLSQGEGPVAVALDDTTLRKTGRHIPGAAYLHDPRSAPWRPGFMRGQRFIQASVLLRPEGLEGSARAIPVRFEPAPPPAKPSKRADAAAWQAYREAQRTQNLSVKGRRVIVDLRESLDQAGYPERLLLVAVDGSYCNRNVLRQVPERVEVIARARGDIRLFRPLTEAEKESLPRRKYGPELPRPREVLRDPTIPWRSAKVFGAGRVHDVAYKVIERVLWRSGTRDRPLRLFVIRPLRYRPRVGGPLLYRDPAYLLTTDLESPDSVLLQAYFDRWEIEVNHRDEKDLFGVGQAQVWSEGAAWRVPQFQVAVYALLLLAALEAYGPRRTPDYLPPPKWRRRESRRPSILDILALLREELMEVAIDGFVSPVRREDETPERSWTDAPRTAAVGVEPVGEPTRFPPPVDPITAALYAAT